MFLLRSSPPCKSHSRANRRSHASRPTLPKKSLSKIKAEDELGGGHQVHRLSYSFEITSWDDNCKETTSGLQLRKLISRTRDEIVRPQLVPGPVVCRLCRPASLINSGGGIACGMHIYIYIYFYVPKAENVRTLSSPDQEQRRHVFSFWFKASCSLQPVKLSGRVRKQIKAIIIINPTSSSSAKGTGTLNGYSDSESKNPNIVFRNNSIFCKTLILPSL